MVETDRVKEACTSSKGGQGGHIRHNADGGLPEPTIINQEIEVSRRVHLKSWSLYEYDAYHRLEAEKLTLRYYFDDDWFDKTKSYNISNGLIKRHRNKGSGNIPFRCDKCSGAFHQHNLKHKPGIYERLPMKVFNGVLLKSGDCGMCENE
jgi:hypothetical protein